MVITQLQTDQEISRTLGGVFRDPIYGAWHAVPLEGLRVSSGGSISFTLLVDGEWMLNAVISCHKGGIHMMDSVSIPRHEAL